MLRLLKNRGFSLQAVLGVLYLLGMILGQSEGLQCYSCKGPSCDNPDDLARKYCIGTEDACFKSGSPGSMTRGCYSRAKAACVQKTTDGDCYNANAHKNFTEQLGKCIEETRKEGETPDLPSGDQGTTCVCTQDLCNEGLAQTPGDWDEDMGKRAGRKVRETKEKKGLKCSACTDNCPETVSKDCDEGQQYCITNIQKGKIIQKDCTYEDIAACLKNIAGTDGCSTFHNEKEYMAYDNIIESGCAKGRKAKTRMDQEDIYPYSICVCNDMDHCNSKTETETMIEHTSRFSQAKTEPSGSNLFTILAIVAAVIIAVLLILIVSIISYKKYMASR